MERRLLYGELDRSTVPRRFAMVQRLRRVRPHWIGVRAPRSARGMVSSRGAAPSRSTPTASKRDPERTPEPFGGRRGRGRPALRRAEARGAAPALRPAPRDGRGAEELGGAQGAVGAPGGEAARGPRRGSPDRVRRLRGRDPRRQLRRRLGDRVGPRLVPLAKGDDPLEQLERGKLEVELFGHKLRGRWTLARMAGRKEPRRTGCCSRRRPTPYADRRGADRALARVRPLRAHRRGDGDAPARRAALGALPRRARRARAARWRARRQPFMLATLVDEPPSDPDWLFEIKYDGVRVLAERRGETR